MLHKHYRALANRKTAAAYWQITPDADAGKVVAMPASQRRRVVSRSPRNSARRRIRPESLKRTADEFIDDRHVFWERLPSPRKILRGLC